MKALALALATLAASIAPAAAFVVVFVVIPGGESAQVFLGAAFIVSLAVTFAHVLLLGLPLALVLLRKSKFSFRSMFVAGILVGLVPAAIVNWSSYWLEYLQLVSYTAGLGGLGGIVFYATYRLVRPNNSFKADGSAAA